MMTKIHDVPESGLAMLLVVSLVDCGRRADTETSQMAASLNILCRVHKKNPVLVSKLDEPFELQMQLAQIREQWCIFYSMYQRVF